MNYLSRKTTFILKMFEKVEIFISPAFFIRNLSSSIFSKGKFYTRDSNYFSNHFLKHFLSSFPWFLSDQLHIFLNLFHTIYYPPMQKSILYLSPKRGYKYFIFNHYLKQHFFIITTVFSISSFSYFFYTYSVLFTTFPAKIKFVSSFKCFICILCFKLWNSKTFI